MRLRSDRRLIFIYVSCLLIAGCDDDPMPAQLGAVTGRVTNVRTGEGIPGVTIALVDPVRIVIAGAPAQTGADGSYRIAGVAPGDYTAFYFQPGGFGSFDRSAPKFHVEADRDTRWDVRLVPTTFYSDSFSITGTVRDAANGTPVAGVAVMPPVFVSYEPTGPFEGFSLPYWTVTDAAGHFTVTAVAFHEPLSIETLGLFPLSFTHPDYRPATIVGHGIELYPGWGQLLPVPADSVLEVEVQLRPEAGSATGAVRGVVQFAGAPVAGVRVALAVGAVSNPDTVPAAAKISNPGIESPLPDKVTVSGPAGEYVIGGLHPGYYAVHAAFETGDGYTRSDFVPFVAVAADTADAGPTPVVKALSPLHPLPGTELTLAEADSVFLDWEEMPEPAGWRLSRYEVQASGGFLMDVVGNPRTPPLLLGRLPAGTTVRWTVFAYMLSTTSSDSLVLGNFEDTPTFTVAPSASLRP